MPQLPFQDRADAGRRLAAELSSRNPPADTLVLALPRGGLAVAAEVARVLRAPLDLVVVRKLGVPWQPELAMGAIAGHTRVLDHRLIAELRIADDDIEAVAARETREWERREKAYRSGLPAPDLRGRTVVLIDDGLATGSTMLAAARHVRGCGVQKLTIAVPVASTYACARLKSEADECIFLAAPDPFVAVGQWYRDFRQVADDEVREILNRRPAAP